MLTLDKITHWNEDFKKDKTNILTRNAVVSMGSLLTTIDSNELNKVDHIFINSLKHQHIKASNQGQTGRCWLFAGMNMFRHRLAKAFKLENFEFSTTYLFFFDKLERANTYMQTFIDNPDFTPNDKLFKYIVNDFIEDGGWWNMFANLVNKYGLVPKNAMKETFQSEYSVDMNDTLNEIIQSNANYIMKHRKKLSENEVLKVKEDTLQQVYNALVKYLGEPPTKFKWSFISEKINGCIIQDMTPLLFTSLTLGSFDMCQDYVVLTNMPNYKYDTLYTVKHTKNIVEMDNFTFYNIRMSDMVRFTLKSIFEGHPLWFAADVSKNFNPYYSTLDDRLDTKKYIFGDTKQFSKSDRMVFQNLQANHAMTLMGVNINGKGEPLEWQVENSWGYWNNDIPGEDGFLTMSHSWFKKNVIQVVIRKDLLSRSVKKKVNMDAVEIEPWNTVTPALKIRPISRPKNYIKYLKQKKR